MLFKYPSVLSRICFLHIHILSKVFRSTAKHPFLEEGESDVDLQKVQGVIRLLKHLKSPNIDHVHVTSIKFFDFSTLYTTIPNDKLKKRTC